MNPQSVFKALSDSTRLRCILLLTQHKELCVCELTQALGLPQPKISHHLGTLRQSMLVKDRKEGLWIHYRINPDLPDWIIAVLQDSAEGLRSTSPFAEDSQRAIALSSEDIAGRCATI